MLLLLFAASTYAAVFEGLINDPSGYRFIGKFVFDTSPDEGGSAGNLTIDVEVEGWAAMDATTKAGYTNYEVWLFDDEENSWPAIYGKDIPCQDARKMAKNYNAETGIISGTFALAFDDATGKASAKAEISQRSRDRYWYAIVAHCKEDGKHNIENIRYRSHFVNMNRGYWDREFGANQAGLQTLYLCFFLLYLPFMIIHFFGVVKLSQKLEFVHPMVKLFAIVILLQMGVVLSNLCYWCAYVTNGMGLPSALVIGELLDCFGRTMFILILMLMAKGWTISGDELPNKKFVIIVVSAFFVADALIIIWKFLVEDAAAVVPDLGVTVFLYLITIIWLVLAVWFSYTLIQSYRNEDNPVKKTLYRNLAIVYFPWFFGLPLVTLLTLRLNPWVAERIVKTVSLIVSTAGYAVLSYLLWPSRAEEYFNISTPDVMKAQIDTYEQL